MVVLSSLWRFVVQEDDVPSAVESGRQLRGQVQASRSA